MSRDDEIAAALRPTFAREAVVIADKLEEASRDGRRDDVRRLAHRLVGSAGTVRELALVDASRELELLADNTAAADENVATAVTAIVAAVRRVVGTVQPLAPGSDEPEEPGSERPVVVAIEDSPANVTLLRRIFESIPDVELVTTQSGRDGARLAVDRRASLVLLDLNLPDVSGEWVLEELRGEDGQAVTNVVVVSADATPGQAEHAKMLGASGYVAKPFDIARLRTIVRDACLHGENGT